jgi:prepilin peptidase CpaA
MERYMAAISLLLSAVVIISDLYARRVPNEWLILTLALGALIAVITWKRDVGGPPWPALLGLTIGLATLLPFHIFGWMGAGDVKFFAVLGFLLGSKALLPIWIIASLIAGVHAALVLLSRNLLLQAMPGFGIAQYWLSTSALGQRVAAARQGRKGLPYAAWLGVGALITIFNPELMHW